MPEQSSKVEADRQAIVRAKEKGGLATTATYARLSGPGWLQSALTLGGGSLGSSLYLGVLAGFSLLWLQPFAMILGIVMLSAIGYVAMSTPEPPFQAINRHINPVLGWGWALASLLANMVWCLPQYSLASGVLQQNLLPGVVGEASPMGDFWGKVVISAVILLTTLAVTWAYDSGGWGIKLYELLLKLVVAGIVVCFVGVVIVVAIKGDLGWGHVLRGFIPDVTQLWKPSATFNWLLETVPAQNRGFWTSLIVDKQQDVIFSAAATAVGINMTFLLPYSMIRRGWDKDFRGLAQFDLSTGMFIPFVLATSCVVIASAAQFHTTDPTPEQIAAIQPDSTEELPKPSLNLVKKWLEHRLGAPADPWLRIELVGPQAKPTGYAKAEFQEDLRQGVGQFDLLVKDWTANAPPSGELQQWKGSVLKKLGQPEFAPWQDKVLEQLDEFSRSRAEIVLASHLEEKDAFALSASLSHLTGKKLAHWIFGIGVLGMTLSSITLLMLISGFVICEMLGLPPKGWPNRLGCLAATTGVLGPFLWAEHARFWLVVPTSVFCFTLLPFAYLTFVFVMNSKSLLGDQMPRGGRRVAWNVCMGVAASLATAASLYMVWNKARYIGLGAVAALALLVVIVHFAFPRNAAKK